LHAAGETGAEAVLAGFEAMLERNRFTAVAGTGLQRHDAEEAKARIKRAFAMERAAGRSAGYQKYR
jgi:hypothetical protein